MAASLVSIRRGAAACIADYDEAIRLDPKNPRAFNKRGFVYHDKGDDDRAVADFNEAIQLNPRRRKATRNVVF
jgi:Flp pilus assembly protein TadD